MNIGEAHATYTVIRALAQACVDPCGAPANAAVEAAAELANKANKALGAGPTGEQVAAALEGGTPL